MGGKKPSEHNCVTQQTQMRTFLDAVYQQSSRKTHKLTFVPR